jgi:glucans biosynthesis protein
VSTRTGAGGVSGGDNKASDTRKFVIDFRGGALDSLPQDASLEAVVTASAGEIQFPVAQRNPEIGGWRAFFDLKPAGDGPAELRCFLRQGSNALTETWSFQWTP